MAEERADPCRWPVRDAATKKNRPCGWAQSPNLRPHLKSHKFKGKSLTADQYRKRFPKAYLGPALVAAPEQIKRFLDANPNKPKVEGEVRKAPPVVAPPTPQSESFESYNPNEERIQERAEELHRMVLNDPAAKHFCIQAAREEDRNVQLSRQLDLAMIAQPPDLVKIKMLRQACADSMEELKGLFNHLSLSIKERRKDNQLGGNDTVSQIMSNYAQTRRRWPESRNLTFNRLIAEWRLKQEERVQRRIIDEAPRTLGGGEDKGKTLKTNDDYNSAILSIGEPVRQL